MVGEMKRTEFRKLKMFDKLQFIKSTLEYKLAKTKDEDMNYLIGFIDECIYSTREFGILKEKVSKKQRKRMVTCKKANEIFDGAFELSAKLKETPDGTERTALAAEANHKFKAAQKMLDGLLKQAKSEGKATAKIMERLAQLKEMNENVVNTYLLGL